jgi:putative transposase
MDTLVACDFFSKKIVCWHGNYTAYVLVFIHLGSRKVYHSYPTLHPNGDWIIQQCRNASMWLEDEGLEIRYLLRDRDGKYPDEMKQFWKAQGCNTVKTPVRAPKANAFCESFIGTLKRECLNSFFCFSLDHLHHINSVWIKYYNTRRPHRGKDIGNYILDVDFVPTLKGTVKCREQLGGIIKDYYREQDAA